MAEIELLTLLILVGVSFAATNLDNLVLMVVLLGAQPLRKLAITLGFVLAALCVLCVAAVGAAIGTTLDPGLIGYMGFAPLALGIYLLLKLYLRGGADAVREADPASNSQVFGVLGTFLLMFGNSADSIAVFFPLLAESERESMHWEIGAFLFMVLLWSALAWKISGKSALAGRIERVGEKLLPWIMIAAGTYILLDTGTDTYHPV